MSSTPIIKKVFGNHNSLRLYLDYLFNPEDNFPPFPPVLHRQICGSMDDPKVIEYHIKSEHKAKIDLVRYELTNKYINYK